jgi:hypothetical protein
LHNSNYSSKKLVVSFHGLGRDLGSLRKEAVVLCRELEMNVLVVEYPGYGLNF